MLRREEVETLKQRPSGTLRIVTPRIAYIDHLEAHSRGLPSRLPGDRARYYDQRFDHGHRRAWL